MTIEKLKELLQIRVDYFEQHLTDEAMTAQLKAYTANLGTVPDEVAEPAFWAAIGNFFNLTDLQKTLKAESDRQYQEWLKQRAAENNTPVNEKEN